MPFDDTSGAYVDMRVARGFPLGGIGSGGFGFNSDGSFGELRLNNNWMCPIRGVRGALHALFVRRGEERQMIVLRRRHDKLTEYEGVRNVRSTSFLGTLPSFTLRYEDDLPLEIRLEGFTPHVPHDLVSSTLPAAIFRFVLENRGVEPLEAAILFSFENVLGRGGTGHLGVDLGPEHELRGVRPRVQYESVAGNHQTEMVAGGRRGVRFATDQRWDPRSHRAGVTGEYLLLADGGPDLELTVCDGWDADASRAVILEDFALTGRVRSQASGRRGEDGGYRPAAGVAVSTELPPSTRREIVFTLAWWTIDHVTDSALTLGPAEPAAMHAASSGIRVGHVYERHFQSVDAVASYALDRRESLERDSAGVGRMLADSSLPAWLVRALHASLDSVLCNTIVPASGNLYTLEGVDWSWPMGGLTGTNDQRLAAHPYTSVFFPELDLTELAEFQRLADSRGAIPHGNGNCDLGLGSTDVPYGWPLVIKGLLPAKEWTDLTMSFVLQVAKHWRTTGRAAILHQFWPALIRGMEYLHGLATHGVPEGGTTYDVWDFPGAFVYSATLYLATLRAMINLAATVEPARAECYRRRFETCAAVLDTSLWDPRGFYRSTPDHDSLFTGALAGDWAARYLGLDPVVDPVRAASHLRHQHRVLVEESVRAAGGRWHALPRAEASFEGTPVRPPMAAGLRNDEEFVYVWQVLAYQAMEQIYVGQVATGLETMQLVYDRLWHDGNAWSGGLRGNDESIYMTHPVIWAALNALTGAALDLPCRTLHLAPRPGDARTPLRCPLFFPTFWAMLEHDPTTGATTLDLSRTFGEPPTIERIVTTTTTGDTKVIAIAPTPLTGRIQVTL